MTFSVLVDPHGSIAGFQCHTVQNTSKSKSKSSRIWEKKEGKYAKTLAKIQVTAILLKQDMRINFFTQIHRD